MEKILVLLSTYNGHSFLAEQIDSLFNQKGVETYLLVRDDGSKDDTIDILKRYLEKNPSKIKIIEGHNIGWKKSFFELIKYAATYYPDFDYFAFCDQDDIWLPNKLHRGIDCIKTLKNDVRLYLSDLIYYKNGVQYGKIRKGTVIPTVKNCLIRNYATGCTLVFNKKLLHLIDKRKSDRPFPHDYWAYLVGVLCGAVYCDPNSYILYRQHENNQIGIKNGFFSIWQRRIKRLQSSIGSHEREVLASELKDSYTNYISKDGEKALDKVINYRKSFKSRMQMLLDNDFTYNKKSNDFWLKVRIILGCL